MTALSILSNTTCDLGASLKFRNSGFCCYVHFFKGWYILKDLILNYRYLEDGNLEAAAAEKQRIEELQRCRRRYLEENNMEHVPKFFK